MRTNVTKKLMMVLAIAGILDFLTVPLFSAVVASAEVTPATVTISYTVSGWGPNQYPAPTTPPEDAPWGVDGYPGDTLEMVTYVGTLDLTPGTYDLKINTFEWTIDYTYGGTETDPDDWSDVLHNITAVRSISFSGGPSGSLGQTMLLKNTWFNDYVTINEGGTASFTVGGYQVDVTPLGVNEFEGTDFSGSNPWAQPDVDIFARFEVTERAAPSEVWVDDDWTSEADVDAFDPGLTWQYDAFSSLQDGVDAVAEGGTVNVRDGTYGVTGQKSECEYGFPTAILIKDLDNLTIQAAPGHEPVVKPVTAVEANIVSITIHNSNHLTIDNIDSDQTIAQFDNWHVCDSDDLTVRNSRFEGGEDGIDFNTDLTTALIENNEFIHINTGSGDEVLDFTDGSYSDVVIQGNLFENNYRHITINPPSDDAASDFIIRRNFMDGTTSQEGVRFNDGGGPISDTILENNVIMNSRQQGLYVKPPVADITVRHNTFFNNTEEEIRLREAAGDVVIKNNIIYANGTHAAISAGAPFPPGPLPGEDFNLIFNDGLLTESGSASPITVFGPNTITGLDPLFVSTTLGSEDLHLQPGSPAIEAGTDLGVTDDIEKNVRPDPAGTDPDMGAYEVGPPAPRVAKQGVIENLSALLPTGDRKTDHRIEKAIVHLERSLDADLWVDDSHLTDKGKKVFKEEKKAVHELMKIVRGQGEVANDVQEAIDSLVEADRSLAQTAIDQAIAAAAAVGCGEESDDPECKKTLKEIAKAQSEMAKAQEELDHTKKDGTPDPKYDKAIDHYRKAWEHAQRAMKKTPEPDDGE